MTKVHHIHHASKTHPKWSKNLGIVHKTAVAHVSCFLKEKIQMPK